MRLRPFGALRPRPDAAAEIASVPYDVVSREEAAALAAGKPLSFLHVVRSEIDLPSDVDVHDERVYARARDNLRAMVDGGVLMRDRPSVYLYRLEMDGRAQVGVVGCVSVEDYERGLIKQHEKTRPDKEDDRTRHMLALEAHPEPVLLTYRDRDIERLVERDTRTDPLYDFEAADGVRHTVWGVSDVAAYVGAFASIPHAYVADGHHRCAAATRAARQLAPRRDEARWFPAVLFPAGQVRILPYNRLVRDLNGVAPAALLEKLAAVGRIEAVADPVPPRPGTFGIYLARRWHLLELDTSGSPSPDPASALDAALIHDRVLRTFLGIGDARTDPRLEFVGGIRGTAELERRVDSGEMALAVSMYPVTVEQLMAVADAGGTMPPKSTWFEPKLRSGLFVHAWS